MKIQKYIYIVLIFLLCMLAASAVSAADDSANDIISADDNNELILDESISDDVYASINEDNDELFLEGNDLDDSALGTDEKPALSEGEAGSFTDLNTTLNGNSEIKITLDRNYTYNPETDTAFIHGININRTVTINGNNNTIDGLNIARIFTITADNVIIKNITFTNGKADGDNWNYRIGGAICWTGSKGGISYCTFTNNTGVNGDGGAVFCDGGGISFFNCVFTENSNTQGGAIKIYAGDDYTITNCIFIKNNAGDGGAIFQCGYNTAIFNSTFTKNNAETGGAIYQNNDNVTISNSTFADNSASNNGGAITWAYSDNGTVIKCTFTNNSASKGCAINLVKYNQNKFDVSECSFIRNIGNNTIRLLSISSFIYSKISNNIFLNNIVESNILYLNQSSDYTNVEINADDNWFGSNTTNYAQRPISNDNIICDSWLFLNGTANPKNITVLDTSSIIFKLYKYNSSSKDVTEYDNTLLPAVNLTISSQMGTADKGNSNLNKAIEYTATAVGTGSITASVESAECTVELNNEKGTSSISIDMNEIYYVGDAITITFTPVNSTGDISVTINGEAYPVIENKVEIPNGLSADTYEVNATLSEDENYYGSNCTETFKVNRIPSSISVNDTASIAVGESQKIEATLIPDGGNLIYAINDTSVASVSSDGIITAHNTGIALITISFEGNATHTASSAEVKVTVIKAGTLLSASDVSTTYNVNKELTITLKDMNGNALSGVSVTVDLNGAKTYTTDKNGQVKVAIGKLTSDEHTAKISFDGNDNYLSSSATAKVTVKKASSKITAKAKKFKYEDKTKKYTITLKDNNGKVMKNTKVTLKVNGKTYTAKTNSKGKATFKLTKLTKKGKYNAVVKYAGDKNYKKATKKAKITVKAPAWKTVAKGSKDKATVKKIQRALKNNGYYLSYKGRYLKVDGKYNSCTVRSVKQFQKAKGLKVTGKVDYATAKKLKIVS